MESSSGHKASTLTLILLTLLTVLYCAGVFTSSPSQSSSDSSSAALASDSVHSDESISDTVSVTPELPITPAKAKPVTYGVWLRAMRDTIASWEGEREVPNGSNRNRKGNISRVQIEGCGYDGLYYCCFTIWGAAKSASKALKVVNPLPRTGRVSTMFTYANSLLSPMSIYGKIAVANGKELPELFLFGYGREDQELVVGRDGPAHIGMGEKPIVKIIPTHEGNRSNMITGATLSVLRPDAFIVFDMDKEMERVE